MGPQQEFWVEGQRASLEAALGIISPDGEVWVAGKDPMPVCCWRSQCDKQTLVWTKSRDGYSTHFYVRVTYSVLDIAHSCEVNQLW